MKNKKEINVQIGDQIRKAREERGLTQEKFAELIGKTPQFISDMERGVSGVSMETLKTICECLCITSDSILFSNRPKGADNIIESVIARLRLMPPEQLEGLEQIINAYEYAINKAKAKRDE